MIPEYHGKRPSACLLLDGIPAWVGDVFVDISAMPGYEITCRIRYSLPFFQPQRKRGMEIVQIHAQSPGSP
jgi:hypothetical protein